MVDLTDPIRLPQTSMSGSLVSNNPPSRIKSGVSRNLMVDLTSQFCLPQTSMSGSFDE